MKFSSKPWPKEFDINARAWLGLDIKELGPRDVRCIAIYQDTTPDTWVERMAPCSRCTTPASGS